MGLSCICMCKRTPFLRERGIYGQGTGRNFRRKWDVILSRKRDKSFNVQGAQREIKNRIIFWEKIV